MGVDHGCRSTDRTVVALVAAITLVAAACGGDGVEPSDIAELPDGTYMLYTNCADEVSAVVTENDGEIRVDEVRGDVVDGDCVGAVPLDLDAPIGACEVVVNGDR